MTVSLPGAAAGFSDKTRSPALTFPVAALWNCPDAGAAAGATRYYRLQDSSSTAANTGTAGSAANGTYSATGVSRGVSGPNCGVNDGRAVRLDGQSGAIWTTQAVTDPQTFSVQLWFSTTTNRGGKLIGFGNGTNGDLSSTFDRHVYMTNDGQLVFGVYSGTIHSVVTPRSYNDGGWHLVSATFSAGTGMRLYVDGALVASGAAPAAETNTGYWRIGYDNLDTWPSMPASRYFNGSLAQVGVYSSVLTPTQVDQAWQVTR